VEPFKNVFDRALIEALAALLVARQPDFPAAAFTRAAAQGLEALELKGRAAQIAAALSASLPRPFPRAAALLCEILGPVTDGIGWGEHLRDGATGWAVLPLTEVIARDGLDDFDTSLAALREMTRRFSSEFAVRPFLARDQARALALMSPWINDPCHHVRRLVSEGTRPRLPWGLQLKALRRDPSPVLPLLTALRDDPSEYVRRSVANHLNDLSKDHPALVAQLTRDWLRDAPPERVRLLRHACRGLIKAGDAATLTSFGYEKPQIALEGLEVLTPEVTLGGALRFVARLRSGSEEAQALVVDYVVHHRKANGGDSPKVFKWTKASLGGGALWSAQRNHPMRPITTRRYYEGEHRVNLLVNGERLGEVAFALRLPG
jgi:3-methyladenine DNA glycosylase AlkC